MRSILLGIALVAVTAVAASAGECPALQAQIDKQFGNRFDRMSSDVRTAAAQGWALHRAGKHAESVQKYEEAAKAGGVKLERKK